MSLSFAHRLSSDIQTPSQNKTILFYDENGILSQKDENGVVSVVLDIDDHDTEARHTFGAALGTPALPEELGHGAALTGSGNNPSREDHVHDHNPPTCRVFHNTTQSIASNADTTVVFNSERFDTDNMHDTVTNNSRITITTPGLYIVSFTGEFTARGDYSYARSLLVLNTTIGIAAGGNALDSFGFQTARTSVSTIYKFIAGDFITVLVRQRNTAAAAVDLLSIGNSSPEFAAVWVGTGD